MSDVDYVECGNCFGRAYGFYRKELDAEGWQIRHPKGQPFHLCPDCVRRFAEARRLNRLLKLEAAQQDRLTPR